MSRRVVIDIRMQCFIVVEADEPGDCQFSMRETLGLEPPHHLLLQYGVERLYDRIVNFLGGRLFQAAPCQELEPP